VQVHVVPRASATTVAGRHGDGIRIRIAAPPVDGAANEALLRFLAKRLGVSRGAVTIARGQSSRRKTVTIAGISTDAALARLLEDT
jgi:uncharacterized protein (TIGR00251 family)